ncbi:MAG: hypothetical protein GWM98_20280, partial [Nitrospinaceae bacterium]|nr:hypothetical protein [Nitrospinaceae bacterium]
SVEIPDYLSVQMKMNNGLMGSLFLNELGTGPTEASMKIFGDQGILHHDFEPEGLLKISAGPDSDFEEVVIPPDLEGGWRVEDEFINTIRGLEEIEYTTFTTGVEYMKFTQAVNDSFRRNGERMTIPLG